jgi:hypothetical protein
MNRIQRLLPVVVVVLTLFAAASGAALAKKAHHHNGKNLLGGKAKTNGIHVLETRGHHTASVEVKGGKIAGLHVKNDKGLDVPVKKYKTNKKMAQASGGRLVNASFQEYVGTMWIGYAYIDEYGDEEIYWFPYDMILDGDTGAIEYVPAG